MKFALLECICLQTSKLLKFSTDQNGNGTFYHPGCCLFPTALPAQQLARAEQKQFKSEARSGGIFLAMDADIH